MSCVLWVENYWSSYLSHKLRVILLWVNSFEYFFTDLFQVNLLSIITVRFKHKNSNVICHEQFFEKNVQKLYLTDFDHTTDLVKKQLIVFVFAFETVWNKCIFGQFSFVWICSCTVSSNLFPLDSVDLIALLNNWLRWRFRSCWRCRKRSCTFCCCFWSWRRWSCRRPHFKRVEKSSALLTLITLR